jgi:hypothetical protein
MEGESMFEEAEIWLLIKYLGLPYSQVQYDELRLKLTDLELLSDLLVGQIQQELQQLTELDEQIQTQMGIVRVDDIEFDTKQRIMAVIARSIQLLQSVGRAIGIVPDLTELCNYYGTLSGANQSLTLNKVLE